MYQTLEEFLLKPFGKSEPKSNEYETKYKNLVSNKRIRMEASTKVDDYNHLVHIKVGSDSNPTVSYDVVIHFFTKDKKVSKDILFNRYYVKFFSNSPSFIYQYATLYGQYDMLIDVLGEKMDSMYAGKMPEKANPNMRVSYDKSIYAACRYMQDHKVSAYNKAGSFAKRKKSADNFFADIQSFEDIKFNTELAKLSKKTEKTSAKEKDNNDIVGKKPRRGKVVLRAGKATRIMATKSTVSKNGKSGVTRISAKTKRSSTAKRI